MSRCEWYSRTGLPAASAMRRQCGVRVGVNYGGWVRIEGCAFAGPDPEDLAIFEEMHGRGAQIAGLNTGRSSARLMGMWSRPVSAARNSFHAASVGAAAAKAAASKSRFPGDAEVAGPVVYEWEEEGQGGQAAAQQAGGGGDEGGERLPSIRALAARLPVSSSATGGAPAGGSSAAGAPAAATRAFPHPSLLARTGFTFPRSHWSPTAHQFYAIGNTSATT